MRYVVVSAGGVLGALGRFGMQEAVPGRWTTVGINVVGCLLIGLLMPLLAGRPLLQPFVAPGVLGGFTTFSAYAVDVSRDFSWAYLLVTLVGALLAVWAGVSITERLAR